MSEIFKRYKIFYNIQLKLRTIDPLRIGGDKSNPRISEPNLPIIKDANGIPIIPGSSLKGFYSANLERLLRTISINTDNIDLLRDELFGGSPASSSSKEKSKNEKSEKEKSRKAHKSPILFGTLITNSNINVIASRNHVHINRATQGPKNFFEAECVIENTIFTGRIKAINVHPFAIGFLQIVNNLANMELARLGGFKSRGYGRIKIDFTELNIDIVGKMLNNKSYTISSLIPNIQNQNEVALTFENNQFTINTGNHTISVRAKLEENIDVFGSRVTINGDDLRRFLQELVKYSRYLVV